MDIGSHTDFNGCRSSESGIVITPWHRAEHAEAQEGEEEAFHRVLLVTKVCTRSQCKFLATNIFYHRLPQPILGQPVDIGSPITYDEGAHA